MPDRTPDATPDVTSPLSRSRDVTLLRSFPVPEIIEQWRRDFGIDVAGEIGHRQEIRLYRCDASGLLFFWPDDVAGSGRLYEQLQKFDWYYDPHKWEHRVALDDLRQVARGRVMEVGCGEGSFVADGLKAGFNISGIEINDAAVAAAKARGLPVQKTDLADAAAASAGQLDAVCAFQVLEHVVDPRGFLEHCVRLLKPGGLLVLCVPNAESYVKDLPNLLDMPPHHMSRWSAGAFSWLSNILPVELVCTRFEPLQPAHVAGRAAAGRIAWRRRHPALGWVYNRGTQALVAAALRLGLRRLARGQSLYVVLRRRPG